MNKPTIFIVSWYGISEAGGLERVTYHMKEAWSNKYNVEIVDFNKMREKKILCGHQHILS